MFPSIAYQFAGENNSTLLTDIVKRVKVRDAILTSAALYSTYFVKDGETPHVLASKYYGDSNLHWILLLTNTIIDPNFDWPMHSNVLSLYCQNKYGSHLYAVHHYELISPFSWRNGMVMPHDVFAGDFGADLYDSDTEEVLPVSNTEFEEKINDQKRQIALFKPDLVTEFITEFSQMINQ
jgi:hypothetical protein